MRMRLIPSRPLVQGAAVAALASAAALIAGAPAPLVGWAAAGVVIAALAWAVADLWFTQRMWQRMPLRLERRLPQALAIGVARELVLNIVNAGTVRWRGTLFDELDGTLDFDRLPLALRVPPRRRVELRYRVTPRRRGPVRFGGTQLRLRTLGGAFEVLRTLGEPQSLHVYPNFAAVARYAWLAGDRRLSQIGIKTYAQRGEGTDFKQLADYQSGDPIRHIDWKATLRHSRPIVRQFQDERDQCVLFLLDCGRRMRADEGVASADGGHFDQALNALMLLTHVALKEGDEVGATTFGHEPGQQRRFAPRKGAATLNALMARLYDIQPGNGHSDYLEAARDVMKAQRKRALVIVLTNFRDEDAAELTPALKLLRTRHLVLVASLHERVLRELAAQPLGMPERAVDVAGAHWFEQARRDAFRRVTGTDALSVDVEPQQLPVALVNRYHAVKRARLL